MLCQPHRNMFPFPKLDPHCSYIVICVKNASTVEMMIRIPVVMTREIESWPCEELMYCSRASMWREWGFAALARASPTAPLILCNNWLKKTKHCGKGHLRGTCRSKVCLHHPWPWFLYKLALSLSMREPGRRRKGTWAKKRRENSVALARVWIPTRHPSHVCAK